MTKSTKQKQIKNGKVRRFTQADVYKYWELGNDAWVIAGGKETPLTTVRRWIKSEGGFILDGVAYLVASSSLFIGIDE